jgi:hypothetical protein
MDLLEEIDLCSLLPIHVLLARSLLVRQLCGGGGAGQPPPPMDPAEQNQIKELKTKIGS